MEGLEKEKENREILLSAEASRIQGELEKYLGKEKALEVAGKIYALASETEELVSKIIADPSVAEDYDYDGRRLTKKPGHGSRASPLLFDGLNVLKNLGDSTFRTFFRSDHDEFIALNDLVKYVGDYRDNALILWNSVESGVFTGRRRPESPEAREKKDEFFAQYEKQMEEKSDRD